MQRQLTLLPANGTVVDYVPLSNAQLYDIVNDLPLASHEKEHLATIFAKVDGFAVKDHHQIFHPSTHLRPAIDSAQTHGQDTEDDVSEAALGERYVHCKLQRCSTGMECVGMGCDVCLIAHDMSARYCHYGDF